MLGGASWGEGGGGGVCVSVCVSVGVCVGVCVCCVLGFRVNSGFVAIITRLTVQTAPVSHCQSGSVVA